MTLINEARRAAGAAVAALGKAGNGLVSAVDPVNHAAKVMLQPDNVETGWLPVTAMAAGEIRIMRVPSINEHVTVEAMEGDAEHLVVIGSTFDAVVMPPKSPATGKAAQPGELLIMAGQGAPPALGTQTDGAATNGAAWWHMTANALYAGVGNATIAVKDGSIVWTVGGCTMTLSASGLAVTGGTITSDTDVKAASISLKSHVHSGVKSGGDETGGPE